MIRLLLSSVAAILAAALDSVCSTSRERCWKFEPQDASFSLTRLPENPNQYSLVVSEGEERSISGNFSIQQLEILRTIMVEAEKFGLSAESVGSAAPVTTRFADKNEKAFVVDVEKLGNLSRFYLTLNTEVGQLTMDAGKLARSTRREDGLFFDLLSRLESLLPKPPAKTSG